MRSKRFQQAVQSLRSKNFLLLCGIWLVVGAIGVHIRLMPLLTFASHDSMEKASLLLVNNFRHEITAQVNRHLPDMPADQKEQLIQTRINELLHENPDQARRAIQRLARQLDRKDKTARRIPYLLASDSFYYLRQTQKIIEQGSVSSKIKGSKYFNEMMLAPEGHWEPLNLHPYLGAWLYRAWARFNPQLDLMHVVAFTPLVIVCLSLAAFVMVCARLRCHPVATLLGSIYFITAPILVKRSSYGWYDNDPYNALFPLLILAAFFYGLEHRRDLKRVMAAALISMLLFGLYALFWHGWMFLLGIVFGAGILIILYDYFIQHEKKETRNLLIFYALIPIAALAGITLVFGIKEFFILIGEGWRALNDFFKPQLSLWPNLYIGVGELHGASLDTIMELTGGPVAFCLVGMGLVLCLIPALQRQYFQNLYPFMVITVFLFSSLLLTFGAERFALLILIPVSLLIALGLDFISRTVIEIGRDRLHSRYQCWLFAGIMMAAAMILAIIPVRAAYQKWPQLINRIHNDTWQRTLTWIRDKTPPESIINTWWSPGHFIKAIAQRRVTFDGASINKPQAYWLARILMNNNEKQALGLLRMLNGSGNQPVVLLEKSGLSLSESVDLLQKITPLSRTKAEQLLAIDPRLNPDQRQKLLALVFRRPPPSYLLIYNELVEKNIQLSFVSRWDFEEIERIARDPVERKKLLSGPREYVREIWQMQGGQPKFSGVMKASFQNEDAVQFNNQIFIDLNGLTCRIDSDQFGRGTPYSMIFVDGEIIREKKLKDFNLPYSTVLYQRNGRYHCALMDNALANSLIMRLFFFEGRGMRYIRPVFKDADLTLRTQIFVFKVNWDKFLEDMENS